MKDYPIVIKWEEIVAEWKVENREKGREEKEVEWGIPISIKSYDAK